MRKVPHSVAGAEAAVGAIDRRVEAWLRDRFAAPDRMPRFVFTFLRRAEGNKPPEARAVVRMQEYLASWKPTR